MDLGDGTWLSQADKQAGERQQVKTSAFLCALMKFTERVSEDYSGAWRFCVYWQVMRADPKGL